MTQGRRVGRREAARGVRRERPADDDVRAVRQRRGRDRRALARASSAGGGYVPIDAELHAPLDQAMVVCKGGSAGGKPNEARAFVEFVALRAGPRDHAQVRLPAARGSRAPVEIVVRGHCRARAYALGGESNRPRAGGIIMKNDTSRRAFLRLTGAGAIASVLPAVAACASRPGASGRADSGAAGERAARASRRR